MGLWKRVVSRLRGEEDPARSADVGMTYADLERDKPRKEAQLSGAGFAPREAEDEGSPPGTRGQSRAPDRRG